MQMKKNLMMLGIAAVIGALALSGSVAAQKGEPPPKPTGCQDIVLPEPSSDKKVTLCHFTGSDSNPFVINEVAPSAAESHLLNPDHHGDCGRYGTDTAFPGLLICGQ